MKAYMRVVGLFFVIVLLAGCGNTSSAKTPVGAGTPVPVTYFPMPTRNAPVAQPIPATQAPGIPAPTEVPAVVPSDTPEASLSSKPVTIVPPTSTPNIAPTEASSPQPTATTAPIANTGCPATSSETYTLIPIDGAPYKNNAITDDNADFRLLLLGYAPFDASRGLIDLPGGTDGNAPKIWGMFEPARMPEILATYKRNDWNWNEAGPPPYGTRGGVNNDDQAPVAVVDFRTNPGERVKLPARNAEIFTGVTAMVVFASETELTAVYYRQDDVAAGYMVHMANFCVDPNLVAAYRAQLSGGKRSTNQLPAVRNGQAVGTSTGVVTVAIRDRARFLDPRSRKDWWQGAPQP